MGLTLLLVRHGETPYNAENRYQGHRDVPLSLAGRAQAECLARRLRAAWQSLQSPGDNFPAPPVAIYASDLQRARETAEILARAVPTPTGDNLAVRSLPLLRERHFGVWEGLTGPEIRARFPGHKDPEDGEAWTGVWERMNRALDTLWTAHAVPAADGRPSESILVVGHGGSLRAVICRALGVDHQHVRRFRLDNVSLSIAQFWGDSLARSEGRIALLNDTAHLTHPFTSVYGTP